jgi:hypothetical protein
MEVAAKVWDANTKRSEPLGEHLSQLDVPMLLAKHEGCLVFTDEGYQDIVRTVPEARRTSVGNAPMASDEFAAALRDFCESVPG